MPHDEIRNELTLMKMQILIQRNKKIETYKSTIL